MAPDFDPAKVCAVLLDIEGTTTPIHFVFKTLFPYAAAHAEEFLQSHNEDAEIKPILKALRRQHAADSAGDPQLPPWFDATPLQDWASAAKYACWLIERDSKITPLKALQGKIWQDGYLRGELKGEVYPDVAPAFARWRGKSLGIAIFSSGSVLAQQLLFKYSTAGDLTQFLDSYFDTTTGSKREPDSYEKIAAALKLVPQQILFVSDTIPELDAALIAGMVTAHSLRPGVPEASFSPHPAVRDFSALFP